MTRYSALHHACEQWVREMIVAHADEPVPIHYYRPFKIIDERNWYRDDTVLVRPDYPRLVEAAYSHIFQAPAFANIVSTISGSPMLSLGLLVDASEQPIPEHHRTSWLEGTFTTFAIEYARRAGGMCWDSVAFNEVYEHLENYIDDTPAFARVLADVRNLKTEAPIQLNATTRIRAATNDEQIQALTASWFNPLAGLPTTYIEFDVTATRYHPPNTDHYEPVIMATLLALRLLAPNPVGVVDTSWSTEGQPFLSSFAGSSAPVLSPATYAGATCQVTNAMIGDFNSLWLKARKAIRDKTLKLPIARFSDVYLRTSDTDRLLDCWIALESLFLPAEHVSELTFSIALASSYYLAHSYQERQAIQNDMSWSYKWRSYLIHGERHSSPHGTLADAANKTMAYLRAALKRRVEEL
jgi:hypothetical protein